MLTLTDLFCGAGGSSTGAIAVPGVSVRIASNHWDLAVETHNTNHPDADHLCADLSQISPRSFPRTDILWASPECTNHSVARGRKRDGAQPDLFDEMLPDAAAERSRATMWDVPRFAEHHRYSAVIVENVVDAWHWEPFRAWLMAMDSLGYEHHVVFLNSMHAQTFGPGAPQSRDRMYVVFWRKGNPMPDFVRATSPAAVCPECGEVRARQVFKRHDRAPWGRYRSQYVFRCPNVKCRNQVVEPSFRPAAEIIDWSLLGQRIGDRTKPLAEKTLARIRAGIERYWAPMLVPVEGRDGKQAVPVDHPARTMTTRNETGMAFLTQFRDRVRNIDPHAEPLTTVVADGANHGLVRPAFIAELRGGGSKHRPVSDPLCTVVANGNHHGLVTTYYGNGGVRPTGDALATVTATERHALLMRNNTARGDQGQMSTPTSEPARTITTTGHQSLLTADRPTIDVDDVLFRMLEPREIAAAMDFPPEYVMLGNRREQVRLAGNAVTPPAARDLVGIVAESLGVAS
ncbi:DNA cytosine methyltransferase [Mycolicibacterium vanbaalenii]|uniref:DNA cytosine methyltransferase n=1 Tax=Mycolicibacterium vanbaalenii TaxID=110539 RepID=UPI001F22FDA7|nr:DNA cytosine methyltransferase [Mycolicibacterium vanbaalenii]UJL29957.1 DNA cytosine methyltransferase [Mycolicibacterium vanbaalenii]WND56982.1 DNA cytosine methyltransferase [Mycolicibacterium vanbaalenii]